MYFSNKRIFSLFLSIALVVGILVGVGPQTAFAAESKTLTILHVNDVHGNVAGDDESIIGFEKLKTKVDELKAENPNVLLFNAGDTLHGTTLATVSKGESIVNLMDAVGFDAMVPGNHDFNYGYERLLELTRMAKFEILGSNIVKEADGTSDFEPYIIKEFEGLKVGIFGLATEETKVKSSPKNTEGIKFASPLETAEKIVKELEKEKVDVIIALSHLGIDEESDITSIVVAEKVKGIDIIVDGHSHSTLPEGKLVGDTLIVQAHEWSKNIGKVEVEIEDGKTIKKTAGLIDFEAAKNIIPDPAIKAEIEKIEETNKELLQRVIGKTKVKLDGEREVVRGNESNLGNLLTDALIKVTGADVAITNGGGIRDSVPAGDITVGDVLTVFPFSNYPVVIEVNGATLLEALEYGVDAYPEVAGKFPHVAGMSYKIDPNKEVGNRIVDLMIKNEKIDLEKKYKLVTNDFMAIGGDGYEMFKGTPILAEYPLLSEVLADYIEELGEIEPVVEGRVVGIPKEEVVEVPVLEEEAAVVEDARPVEESVEVVEKPAATVKKYLVKSGDVLWKIAKKFDTTWQKLAEFNELKNPHRIYVNQEILIP